ncbi:hypothetical protein EI94DRAFT_1747935 [Lactarius quietus]|nr:hypothetical protein EI94DRAFT_1747935 [Lactarius quietus]
MIHLLVLLFPLFYYGRAQQTLYPAAIPLTVRSPYLSCWMFTLNGTNIAQLWSTTSAHQPSSQDPSANSLNMPVLVRVDNITYSLLGYPYPINETSNLTNTVITPTQTQLTAEAGPMQFNLTFLNPIEPGDWVKQSIPFSYMSLTAKSLDGASHAVQVYSDLSSEWLSADWTQKIVWGATANNDVVYLTAQLQSPAVFSEISTQPEWGTLYHAMKSGGNITYTVAQDSISRTLFQLNGVLDNQTDPNFHPIDANFTVWAIARDLGTIQVTQDPVVWAVGFVTDPAINYTDLSGASQQRSLFYRTQYPDTNTSLVVDFLRDFANASSRAQQLDSKILQDAAPISGLLGDLVALSTAQVYGSMQLTIGTDASGNFNESDVMAFMKNVGGLKTNRVNAVETLYSAFPAFMYIDPKLGGLLLEPLFRLQASPNYTIPYAAPDLGPNYPNVTVSNSTHAQGVEQSGNMLIMTYAYARASGDGNLIGRYYKLLTSWADYLSSSTLLIRDQTSADGLSTNNQTNLAIKGIIAIQAMSKMSSIVKEFSDVDKYSHAAAGLYAQWKNFSLAGDQHLLAEYGQTGSWTLGYNLFADIWLGTGVVESSVYSGQSSFIDNLTLTSSFSKFGMPVDNLGSDTGVAVSSWDLFVAAMTSDQNLRTDLISRVHNRASFNESAGVFPTEYDGTYGSTISGGASPAQGAMYAPLALKAPVVQITANLTTTTGTSSKSHTGAIVGGAICGVAGLLAVGTVALVLRHRRRQSHKSLSVTVTPYSPANTEAEPPGVRPQTDQQQQMVHPFSPLDTLLSSPSVASIPVGLSSKELAQLRSNGSRSEPTDGQPSDFSSAATIDRDALGSVATEATPLPEAQRLWSEVDLLRHEVQQLRAERTESEAPPTYVSEAP